MTKKQTVTIVAIAVGVYLLVRWLTARAMGKKVPPSIYGAINV